MINNGYENLLYRIENWRKGRKIQCYAVQAINLKVRRIRLLKTLSLIADRINGHKLTWGVGGSLLLSFYNIVEKPNDIDILVDESNAASFNEIMSSIGERKDALRSELFHTTHFSKYRMNGIDIDVMGGFAVQHDEGVYKISLQEESIVSHKTIYGVDIPLCALEDWYVLY